jgi:hypothetical protein
MLKLFYTGASRTGDPQIDPLLSLGGNVSSSEVPNLFFNSLFQEVTNRQFEENSSSFIALALLNEEPTAIDIEHFTFATTRDSVCSFKAAFLSPTLDDCDKPSFQQLQNPQSAPRGVSLEDLTSYFGETILELPVLPEGAEISVLVDGLEVAIIYYNQNLDDFEVLNSAYEMEVRFNLEKKSNELFLIQLDLFNFEPSVEMVLIEANTQVGSIQNFEPTVKTVSIDNIQSGSFTGIYIGRFLARKALRQYKNQDDCQVLFDLNDANQQLKQEEIVTIYIDYGPTITP